MATERSSLSSLKAPSSLAKPRFEASARPRFSNSSVTSRRCSRTFIHPWKTRKDTTIGTTDQKMRARKLVKPRNLSRLFMASLDHVRGAPQDSLRDFQAELLRRLEIDGEVELPRGRVWDLRRRAPREDGLGQLAGLAPDVLAAREREREERPHLRVTVREPEQRNLLAVGEQQH